MARRAVLLPLLLLFLIAGCTWSERWARLVDRRPTNLVQQGNRAQYAEVVRATQVPPPPEVDELTVPVAQEGGERREHSLSLHAAIEAALSQSQIVRVAVGDRVTAGRTTFYDVDAAEERAKAALAAFDSRFESLFYTNEFQNPPDAFFGPGLAQPELQDEAAITARLTKPLIRGGRVSAAYNPDPGYLFLPGSTSAGFNPRYVSELELSYQQPLLRNAGLQVNIAPIQVAKLEVEQTAWEFKNTLMSSVRSVVEAFWELYTARVAVDEYEQVIPLLEEIVRVQEEALQANLVIRADVARARARLYEFQQEYLRLQSDLIESELRVRNLMNLPPTDGSMLVAATAPTEQKIRLDANAAYMQAMDNRPSVVQQRLDVAIRRLEVLVANNQQRPDLDFSVLYRLNGLGEDLGDALDQMVDADFADLELNVAFAVPVGRRRGKAVAREARYLLIRDSQLLQQELFSVSYELRTASQRIEFAYREYEQAKQQLEAAREWVDGAQMRYLNPPPDSSTSNWMLQYLDDYYRAIRSRTDAAIAVAATISRYNFEIVRFEEIKGTLLEFFAVDYLMDPCRQIGRLPKLPVDMLGPSHDVYWDPQDEPEASSRGQIPGSYRRTATPEAISISWNRPIRLPSSSKNESAK